MDADLEATLAEGRRRLKQFEERTSHQLDMFDREIAGNEEKFSNKYSHHWEDLRPVSLPLWGVILENSRGERIYKDHVPFQTLSSRGRSHIYNRTILDEDPEDASSVRWRARTYKSPSADYVATEYQEYQAPVSSEFFESYEPSVRAKTIMEGRKWRVNKYSEDDDYVSNPPYGTFLKKPTKNDEYFDPNERIEKQIMAREQPNTKFVSPYWRRKWKIPKNW